jgi:hypothetical protein
MGLLQGLDFHAPNILVHSVERVSSSGETVPTALQKAFSTSLRSTIVCSPHQSFGGPLSLKEQTTIEWYFE